MKGEHVSLETFVSLLYLELFDGFNITSVGLIQFPQQKQDQYQHVATL